MKDTRRIRFVAAALGCLLVLPLGGCVRRPVPLPVALVPETMPSEIHIAATPASQFGEVAAYGIGFASGSPATYQVSGAHVFAVDRAGRRVAPLSVDEAALDAGDMRALVAALEGGVSGGLLAGLAGAIPGAILGAAHGASNGGKGAAIGAGLGFAVGALAGFFDSKSKTEQEATAQLQRLALGDQPLKPGIPVSGFVFYPRGEYVAVRAVVVEQGTQQPIEVRGEIVEGQV